jgi:hypothetical protein
VAASAWANSFLEDAMAYLRVVAALSWLALSGALAINWWLEEPINGVGQAMLAFAVLYVLCRLAMQASDAVEHAVITRHRHLDRRSQI